MTISYRHRLWLALLYFLFTAFLFFLPGPAFPKSGWMTRIHFDKWVHFGLFGLLGLLWCWALSLRQAKHLGLLILLFILYGWAVEIIQREWVAYRSFDIMDLLMDSLGVVGGVLFWKRRVTGKK